MIMFLMGGDYTEVNDRVKLLRNEIGLTQTEFGNKIGFKQNTIGQMENGQRGITDRAIILICQSFNVNEEWLRTGEGKMFRPEDTFSLDEYVRTHGFSDVELRILKAYLDIPKDLREKALEYFDRSFSSDSEIDREVQSYREELEEEKRVGDESPALPDTEDA